MKVHNKIIKAFGALLIAALLFAAMPAGEVKAADIDVNCTSSCDQSTIQTAIGGATAGDTINVSGGPYVFTGPLNVNKDVTLNGVDDPLIQVSGTGYRINMSAAGATLQGFHIEKTDITGVQNIIYVGANDLTIQDNKIWGRFTIGENDVSRAMESPGGLSGLLITNNEIYDLRQPMYINGVSTGTISNNHTYRTKGWVVAGGNLTFTGNIWGTGEDANVFDIAILNGVSSAYYTDVAAMSTANNNASIEDQRTSPATLTPVYVDASAPACSDDDCGTAERPYQSIQEGIARVAPGGTVHVAAGTYVEGITQISKSLTIIGSGSSKPIITPMENTGTANEIGATGRGWFQIHGGAIVTFENLEFDGTGKDIHTAVHYHEDSNGGSIIDCDFANIKYSQYKGRGINNYGTHVDVEGCTFSNIERIGVFTFNPTASTNITGCTYTGKGVGDWLDYGVEVGGGATATITDNNITDCLGVASSDGSASAGILATTYFGPGTTATITDNTFSNNTMGIGIGYDETDTAVVTTSGNTFTGNEYHIDAMTATNIDIADALANNTFDKAVVIDGGLTIYSSIQDAIDDADPGDTINVYPGDYVESVNVDKGVTLQGPGMVETFTDSLVVDDWYTDRYEPGVFEVDTFLGESVLKHGVLASDFQTNTFYNYQGKKFDITTTGPEQTWSIDLYVDPAWETSEANAGFWATGYDSEGAISAYPIVAWRSGGSDPAGFYSFDYIIGGWLPLFEASADDYGKWHNFAMTYTVGTGVEYFVDGVSRLTFADPDTVKLANIILNVYNFGEDYDVYWDNFGTWDAKVVGQMDIEVSDVAVNGLILSNPGAPYGMLIDASVDTVDITENLFADIGGETLSQNVKGIYLVHGSDNVKIENNLFERIFADAKSVNAIFSGDSTTTDPAEGLVIQDNRFQNITSQTKGGYGILLNNGAGNPAALIDGNRFSGISGGWTHAVGMEGPTLDAVVTDNTFYNLLALSADNSAVFFEVNPTGASVDVSGNRFQHLGYGVAIHPNDLSAYDYTVDASLNYWGSACGPSPLAADAGPNVAYAPWYADVDLTSQTSSGTVFGDVTFPADSTLAYMQEQVTCAVPGTIFNYVYVEGETYPGGLIINRPELTFNLNGATMGAGSPAYTVIANYTVINGPGTLDGGGSSDHAIVVADGVIDFTLDTVEILGWADGLHFNGVITDTVIVDNFIHDNTGDAVYFGAQPVAQTDVSFYIQGNLFKHNAGVGVNNAGTTDVNAKYNSWSEYLGDTGLDWDGSTNADTDPFTHVDLYMVSTNPDVDNWPNQVFVDDLDPITPNDTITYQVKAHVVNLTTASFDIKYPTDLLDDSPIISNINITDFFALPGMGGVIVDESVPGVISFDAQTGTSYPLTPLSGDILLFEVTFTGAAPGVATLDFDETTDEFGMSPSYGPSNNIYADELVDATLNIITRPTLSADGIEGPYVAGISQQITLETCNAATGGDWTESVAEPIEPDTIGWVRISDITIAEIASLQFLWEGNWYDFSVQDAVDGTAVQQDGADVIARFGNYDFGMEIPVDWCDYDAFRVTFVEPGFHDITIELYDMMDTSQNYIGGDDILLTSLGPVTIEVLGNFDVTGTIAMQGRTVRSDVPLTLTDVDGAPLYGPFDVFSTSELAYNVNFSGVNGSIYELTTLQPRYLNITAELDKQISITGAYTMTALELRGGNAVWENHASSNNKIDIYDASEVGSKYGSSGDLNADVNFDGKVNIQDLALVGGNFDLNSATAYSSWMP